MTDQYKIEIEAAAEDQDGWVFVVTIRGNSESKHTVSLSRSDLEAFSNGHQTPKEFIKSCFEFLLEREPPTAILKSFDVRDIERYFPEFRESKK